MRKSILGFACGLLLGVGATALAANNFIQVDITKRLGATGVNAITQLAYSRDTLALLKNDMDNQINGTDYSVVEAQFGLPTGKGQTFYNLVAGAVTDINASANVTQLIYWTGTAR